MKVVVCIPARYGSVRFPGKVLAKLGGKPVVQWVYEKAAATSADEVLVATDDQRVMEAVQGFGGKAVMTSPHHPSGTDRIWEATQGSGADVVVNIQGDEPLIAVESIERFIRLFRERPDLEMATMVVRADREKLAGNPNIVKAVLDKSHFALYFSRACVPFLREGGEDCGVYQHWGVYGFRRETLERFVSLPEGALEKCEKLEQLRALENGIRIYALVAERPHGVGIDTEADLREAERIVAAEGGLG